MCILGALQFETRGWYLSQSYGFKYDGEILYHENGLFSCLNLVTTKIKRLRGTNSTDYDISCFRYEPTLFYVQGMMNYSAVVDLVRRGRSLSYSGEGNLRVSSWENVVYEDVIDGETVVVFAKGLNLRPDKE
ncbi:hypothetical protein AgCh_024359 [Apium graveolens]